MNESGFYSTTLETNAAPEPQAATFPWPPAAGTSAFGAFVRTWIDSVFRPGDFFSRMPESGGTGAAILYYFIIGMIGAVFELFWQLAFTVALGTFALLTQVYEAFGIAAIDAFSPILGFLFAPLMLALTFAVVFAAVHASLWIFGGARHGAGATVRVLSYAYGARLFAIIPIIGGLVGGVWMCVLAVIGLSKAHRTDNWRALLAVLLPIVVLFALIVMFGVLMAIVLGLAVR